MHVSRIGLTPVKGGRHADAARRVDLTLDGPVGDRVFCLVDPDARAGAPHRREPDADADRRDLGRRRAHQSAARAGPSRACRSPTGETLKVDYWGRVAALEVVDGPWAAAYSEHLGSRRRAGPGLAPRRGRVRRVRSRLVTTSSLDRARPSAPAVPSTARSSGPRSPSTPARPRPTSRTPGSAGGCSLGDAEVEVRGVRAPLRRRRPRPGDRGASKPRPQGPRGLSSACTGRSSSGSTPS